MVEGKASVPKPVLSGVPQGTVLGPLFFLIYINDISKGLSPGTKLKLFADDSLLYRTIKSSTDSAILQKDLNTLQLWEHKWKMEFHPGKCQLLSITNKNKIFQNDYTIHGTRLERTDAAKYLGVVIDSSLTWKKQYNQINQKASKILGLLKRNFSHCPTSVKSQCYTTLVRPILEYGCSVWDPHHQVDIYFLERAKKRGARFVTNNYRMETGNSDKNLKTLGWDTLEERRIRNKLTYFQKARLKLIDIPTEHLRLKTRTTRLGGDGPAYFRDYSGIDGHRFSFFPDSTNIWNHLPLSIRTCEDMDLYSSQIQQLNLTSIRYDTRAV